MQQWQYHLRAASIGTVRTMLSQQLLIPKHLIFRLRTAHRVQINGQYLPMNFAVHQNDRVEITFASTDFKPVHTPLTDSATTVQPLYETDDVIIVNKLRGDKTHPNQPGEKGATINHIAAYLLPKHQQPYIIHRLDQQTSGAIIFGKNPAVVPILTRLISEKQIQRTYLAWVQGIVTSASGIINQPIGLDPNDQRKRMINGMDALNATTYFETIRIINGRSLLKIKLGTGRTHQIRVHLASIGHPLIGDPLYNPTSKSPLQLHSFQLAFIQPFQMTHHLITAPLPSDFIM